MRVYHRIATKIVTDDNDYSHRERISPIRLYTILAGGDYEASEEKQIT